MCYGHSPIPVRAFGLKVAKNSKWGVFNHLAFVVAEAAFETLRREST